MARHFNSFIVANNGTENRSFDKIGHKTDEIYIVKTGKTKPFSILSMFLGIFNIESPVD